MVGAAGVVANTVEVGVGPTTNEVVGGLTMTAVDVAGMGYESDCFDIGPGIGTICGLFSRGATSGVGEGVDGAEGAEGLVIPPELAVIEQSEPEQIHLVPSATLIQTALLSILQIPNLVSPLQTRVPGVQARGQRPLVVGWARVVAARTRSVAKVGVFILIAERYCNRKI